MYKVCVYAICKDEEKFVKTWFDSMSEADLVIVTDTGSKDNTPQLLQNAGATVYSAKVDPWRFDVARNISLSHVPEDVDICVCTDLDEVFSPGWRENLEKVWGHDVTQVNYTYNWSFKKDGTPDVQFRYFKIHGRNDYVWRYPVHECLDHTGNRREKKVFAPGVTLNHHPDPNKSRNSYLPLLELAVTETPKDARVTYYLGRELMYVGRWQESIDMLKRHLSLPSAIWAEERCASMRWIARCYDFLGNTDEAYNWYFKAIAQAPHMREPYVEMAFVAQRISDWETVFYMTRRALKIKEPSKTYVNMGYCWGDGLNALADQAKINLINSLP